MVKRFNILGKAQCCKQVLRLLSDPESPFECELQPLHFTAFFAVLAYRDSDIVCTVNNSLWFCPWCGKQFPQTLEKTWKNIAEKEFKVTEIDSVEVLKQKMPAEFFSSSWWQIRNIKFKYDKHISSLEHFKNKILESTNKKWRNIWKKAVKTELAEQKKYPYICCASLRGEIYGHLDCKKHPKIRCSCFPLVFEPEKRRFSFSSVPTAFLLHRMYEKDKQMYRLLREQFFYCFWCGKELPKSLAPLWFKIVTTEFGVTDISNQKQLAKKLPPEFLTEEWWKKRGL